MSWTNVPYTTVQQVKDGLTPVAVDGSDDAFLAQLILEAQAAIDADLGFNFQSDGTSGSPTSKTFDGNNARQLLVGQCVEMVSVTETFYSLSTDSQGNIVRQSQTRDITADCVLGPANTDTPFLLERYSLDGFFSLGKRNYTVAGVWGWESVPTDIQRACKRLAQHYYLMRSNAYQEVAGDMQNGIMHYRQQMPRDVQEILDNYRLHIALGW